MNNKYLIGIIAFLVIALFFSYSNKISSENIPKLKKGSVREESKNSSRTLSLYKKMFSTLPEHGMYCIPNIKSSCGAEGCKDVEPNVFVLLGKSSRPDGLFLARCDDKPCDVYDVNLKKSGAYASFETVEPRGMLFKMSTLDNSYIEVITLGTDSLISNGICYSK